MEPVILWEKHSQRKNTREKCGPQFERENVRYQTKSHIRNQTKESLIYKEMFHGPNTNGKHHPILQSRKIKSMQNPVARAQIHRRLYLEKHSEFHTEALVFFMLCVNINSSSQKLLVNHTSSEKCQVHGKEITKLMFCQRVRLTFGKHRQIHFFYVSTFSINLLM